MPPIKVYDAGRLTPYALHALYEGLAASLGPDDHPWLVFARADRGHISLGASQDADAELDLANCRLHRIPVVQRALGGGAVWVDQRQLCVFFIFPRAAAPRTQGALFDECLQLLTEAFARVGVPVEREGEQDLWSGGRKLLGSGAATVGHSMVLGASLLEHFDAESFAACIRSPSPGFATWLKEALSTGMTDLTALGSPLQAEDFVSALREICDRRWGVEPGQPRPDDLKAMAEAELNLRLPLESGGNRRVRGGIKINRETYLVEDSGDPWIRLLVRAGRLERVACADRQLDAVLQACLQRPVEEKLLHECADALGLSGRQAGKLVQRVMDLCNIPGRDT